MFGQDRRVAVGKEDKVERQGRVRCGRGTRYCAVGVGPDGGGVCEFLVFFLQRRQRRKTKNGKTFKTPSELRGRSGRGKWRRGTQKEQPEQGV